MASDSHAKRPIVVERRKEKGRKKTPRLTKTYDVKIIPATVGVVAETEEPPKKRVAAYCRVSTDQEAQETSLEEQMAHFNTVIAEHPDWELAGIYADEGISGTQVKHRVQFQQMIEDAKAKKIDLILTKSISRFARNVVDCLTNIRLLRNLRPPVSVYFDKERLDSLDEKAEVFLTIHLINSGATALDGSGACVDAKGNHVMKPFWKMTDADIKACLNATDWCRADYEYFRGGGYSSHFRCKAEMPVTMLRFNIVEGIGPVLQIAEGWTADLPDEIHNTIDKRTDPTWPTTWFCPRLTGQGAFTDVYSVMANWGANHGVTVYGHVGADLITLASMLRIPVTMHNVPAEKIYRPHAWASFGTQDQQAADYAACKQYGPLYR